MTYPQPARVTEPPELRPRLGYFVVRVRRLPGGPFGECTGLVEHLGTGEKREFRNPEELAQVVAEWSK